MLTFGLDAAPRAVDFGLAGGALCKGARPLVAVDILKLAGMHNVANALAALALCDAIGVASEGLVEPLKSFSGLPHRVEPVAEIAGVRYVDDSKGTNVGATLAAVEGLGCKVAIVLGGDAEKIEGALSGCGLPVRRTGDMETAVRWLASEARSGDCVLLSPACSSLDMYGNYAERAAAFVAAVRGLSS